IRAGLWNKTNFKILNGVIKQGRNGGTGFIGIGFNPLFLNHMGNTYNEVAGITVDYYGNSVAGMMTSDGHIHHNVLYDRGSVIDNRHMAIRAMTVGQNPNNDVSFNSLRRFRHRGIDSNGKIDRNELYSDSFDTNSFALGGGDNAQLTNNKIFGMGYNPIGVGWGNNLQVKNNFIYLWAFAPTQRSEEYGRKSAVAGMRVTNYDNSVYENMLFEGNVIVLKATDHATMARGIWTTNGIQDRNILYRHNTVKVEAMPGNFTTDVPWNGDIYYNGDVNNAIAAVTIQGNGWTSEEIPGALVFEDNRFMSNVNHIIIGEGYGISSGVRFYRTTLEKIDHDNDHFFAPVRIGFWYWNTLENCMIDTKLVGITEDEMTPAFYGGTGKMEMRYGESKTLTIIDGNGQPLANKQITLTTPDDAYTQTLRTDKSGRLTFDLLTVRHFKYGNSQENGGIAGTPQRTDYRRYIFSADGYRPLTVSLAYLKNLSTPVLAITNLR
ncbi:MAG: carboxypeptidase-like regulatory domain-containing protein, partial [Tannerellaceae bacterium]|nr:carboxypeptidase-like regulatory domain-containing protein [Tannerellaceae bacterium]